jgi:CBS domain containing-hemolysin-like protein
MNTPLFIHDSLRLAGVLALVCINGFFVAAEFALARVRETQLDTLVARNSRRARLARHIVTNLTAYLSATQLGITMASLGLGYIGENVFAELLHPLLVWLHIGSVSAQNTIALIFGFTALTFLHITVGELAPKWSAIQQPLPISLWVAHPLRWFYLAFYPFNVLLNGAARWILNLVGLEPAGDAQIHSEEELKLVFDASQRAAGGTTFGRDIVLNALDLRRRVAREVMRPRQEIVRFDTAAPIAQCFEVAERTRYSRFPLCENGELDKMLGVVHIKDLYAARKNAATGADLRPFARKLIYVPETARLERILRLLLDRRLHMAMVVDEYGGTLGLLTLENIIEELVGQIQDEFDQEKPLVTRASDGGWEIDGALPLHELAELAGEPLPHEGVTTANGWVTKQLGGFPKPGDTLKVGNYDLRVEELDGLRVARLKLTKQSNAPS